MAKRSGQRHTLASSYGDHYAIRARKDAERQAALRAGEEPLVLRSEYEAALADRERLRMAISRHRFEITRAGSVLIVWGRRRAKRKHAADNQLWNALACPDPTTKED